MSFSFWRKTAWKRMVRSSVRSLRVEALEDRVTPAGLFAVGSAVGAAPLVTVFDATTRQQKFTITPFESSFTGGVNVAVGDVTGDGTADVIVGAGVGGSSTVKVYDGTNGTFLKDFTLGDAGVTTGASVAAADYNQDGVAEVVIGTIRSKQPLVQVLRFSDGSALHGYTPLEGSASVSVAAGDVNGDGVPDTIVGAGAGGGPRVIVFNGSTDAQLSNFFAFEQSFTGGVQVTAGDLNADGKADIITAAGFLGGPRVQSFNGATGQVISNFFAYDSTLRAGVTVAAFDANNDKSLDLVTANGKGQTPDIKSFDGRTAAQLTKPTFANPPVPASWDTTAPTVTLTTTAANPTKASPFQFTAKFSEVVNGFTLGGLTVTNGSVSNFTKVDGKTYTFTVTPTANGDTKVSVTVGSAADAAGNGNAASNTVTVNFDTAGPTATINAMTTNDATPTLTGTVSEAGSTVTVTVNGQTYTATVTGTTWSANVTATLAAGGYTVTATATDAAGNVGQSATLANGLTIDLTAPTATVSSSATDPTGTNPIPFTVTFNEDVTGFTKADITVANGSVLGFTATDARTYTLTVVPSGAGAVTVSVAVGTATDAAGNGNAASNAFIRTFNGTVTTAAVTSTETGPTKAATIPVKVTFSGDVTAFDSSDVGLTGGTLANFVAVDGHTYTFNVTPTADGTVAVNIAAGAANDAGGKPTAAASFSIVSDRTAPTANVTASAASTNTSPILFTVTFNEAVDGLTAAALAATNGTIGTITAVDPKTYTVAVTPTADGAVKLAVKAGGAKDLAGNVTAAAFDKTVTSDRTVPVATVSTTATSPSNATTLPFTVTFTEDVTGFTAAGLTVANGTASNFVAVNAKTYTFTVTPTGDGVVTVTANAAAAQDAAGNVNVVALASITSERSAPTATLTSTATPATNQSPIPFRVIFSEPVTGLAAAGIGVTNGTVSNIVSVDAKTYTFDVTPAAQGAVVVTLLANAVQDTASKPNAASAPFTVTFDTTPPAAPVVLRLDAASDTGASNTDGITSDTTPTIVGTAEANAQVKVFANSGSGATLIATVTADASGNWSATPVTALAKGAYSVTATATDAAGNASGASNAFNVVIDT
ncbi:beta strand repeat-containing protein [Limnoglobus roseus]|uniref:VCBS repeat-containing protein n=1 Tax=Limnoglobus roseus TaxID=2598579 RepID=A0A5C1AFW5_9BACT|nr:Ig-like domain-containing protein [Limnoglobus roseus]QEL16632.1 VCBS repeat-containing protein [Limnoglobus roseus]